MSGTAVGGRSAAATNKKRYGRSFYKRIGSMGGTQTYKSGKLASYGFANNIERARAAGAKGGTISRRGKAYKTLVEETAVEEALPKPTFKQLLRKFLKHNG